MAAYAGLASLMSTIEDIMIHPRLAACLDKYQIPSLHEKAGHLLEFIEGNHNSGVVSKEVEDLERRIARAAHAAEDVTEIHIIDQIHAGSSKASLTCLLSLQTILEDMDAILEKANELKDKEGLRLREVPRNSRMPLMETEETDMVGFEDESFQLMDELTSQQSSRRIISIIAMGGAGKTTLAKFVYECTLIKRHFDICAWATISLQYNAQEILSQLLSVQGSSCGGTLDELGERLHKTLWGRRYLIVLDDIWGVEAWDAVRRFFPDNGNGSRVVLTSRLSNVARDCCSTSCISMKPLDEDKNWKLFCRKAFKQEYCPYLEFESIGKEIARSCRGLPLSTVVIGGLLLKSPRSLKFWANVRQNHDLKEKQESFDVLSLSYNHLPPRLKPCFLYMGVFREDSEIRVSKIIRLWVAEGFIRPTNNNCILEEIAEGFLEELIDRNLILVRKRRKNGKIGSCGVHDLVRDLCLKGGGGKEFHMLGTKRHLVFAMPSFTTTNHRLVRVWDKHPYESQPDEFFSSRVNLRYLRCTFFNCGQSAKTTIPSLVSLMWNLQTLIIHAGYMFKKPMIEIWKTRQLRHIKCSNIGLPYPPSPTPSNGLFMMDNLQTLATPVNWRLSKELCLILPNIKKLGMAYDPCLQGYDDSLIESLRNLDCLHKLESLYLGFRSNKNLIYEQLNKRMAFPISLNKLTLELYELGCEDLSMIGSLPQLQVLQLRNVKYNTNKWSPVAGQFLHLKYLFMQSYSLRYWYADKSHFPVLEKLVLSISHKLKEIPLSIGEIPTLELIRVELCSESAAISALRIKEDQLENHGNDALQVQIRLSYFKKIESFREMVEREGLSTNDIQLSVRDI